MTEDDWLNEIKNKDQRIKELEAQINKVINDNHSMQVALDDLALEKETGSKNVDAKLGYDETKDWQCINNLDGKKRCETQCDYCKTAKPAPITK